MQSEELRAYPIPPGEHTVQPSRTAGRRSNFSICWSKSDDQTDLPTPIIRATRGQKRKSSAEYRCAVMYTKEVGGYGASGEPTEFQSGPRTHL